MRLGRRNDELVQVLEGLAPGDVVAEQDLGRRGAELLRLAGHDVATVFLEVLERQPLARELWIVEPGRVRIHASDEDASPGSG